MMPDLGISYMKKNGTMTKAKQHFSTLFGEINIYIAIFGKWMNIHKSKSCI